MLRSCLSFEPKNRTVHAAISELQTMGVLKVAEGGIFQVGTATSLLVVGLCIHCQEKMGRCLACCFGDLVVVG
jgi:hypothetical protein